MNLIRTEQIRINGTDELSSLCHFSKNLWKEVNYFIRQEFFTHEKWIRYNTFAGALKTSKNFKNLNDQTAQQILKVLDRSWNSFLKSIKEWSKNPEKILGKIHNENRVIGIDLGLRNFVTIANNIGTIVNGKNDNWKQEANMGQKSNQNFVQIPPFKLIQMLQYKAEEGIEGVDLHPIRSNAL